MTPLQVEVDLALNAHANARWHHELRKKHLTKLQKTVDANVKAFKAAEKRTNTQLIQVMAATHTLRTRSACYSGIAKMCGRTARHACCLHKCLQRLPCHALLRTGTLQPPGRISGRHAVDFSPSSKQRS